MLIRFFVLICFTCLLCHGCKSAKQDMPSAGDSTVVAALPYDTLSYYKADTAGSFFRASYIRFGDSTDGRAVLDRYIVDFLLKDDKLKHKSLEAHATAFLSTIEITRKEAGSEGPAWYYQKEASCIWYDESKGIASLLLYQNIAIGGAHPYYDYHLQSHSLTTGKPLKLAEVFQAGYEEPLRKLGETAFRAARKISPTAPLAEAEFQFPGDRFTLNNNWAFTADGLRFVFNPYEIASGWMGETEINIPFAQLQPLLKPDWAKKLMPTPAAL